ANKFRTDRAEQLGVDRTIPADAPRWQKLDCHIAHAAELTARDDSLTKKQINELRQLFPDTPLSGILQNIAEFNRLGLRDPMAAAGKLAFAFGAPRTEAELNEWSAREAQRGQQQAYHAQAQAQLEQPMQAQTRELVLH